MIQQCKRLYFRRNKYDKSRSITVTDQYISELEVYVPNEIIDEYAYSELFRQTLGLVEETFRPDQFDSYLGGLLHWLDIEFMEWLISHQMELKRRLSWSQVCELQCNWMGWNFFELAHIPLPEMTIREIWYFNNEKQKDKLYEIHGK